MKLRNLLVVLSLGCLVLTGCSSEKTKEVKLQPAPTYPGWVSIKIDKVGTLQVPPTMLQQTEADVKKELEAAKNDPKKLLTLQRKYTILKQSKSIVCQATDSSKYARVVFSSLPVKDKIPAYGRPLGLKEAEIKDFGEITKEGIMAAAEGVTSKEMAGATNSTIKYLKWQPMKSEIINGAECLHIAYEYQQDKEPSVWVDRYTFFDKNVIYTLDVSSRTAEKDLWHAKDKDINNIVQTLNIKAQ